MKLSFQYNVLIAFCLLYGKLDSCDGVSFQLVGMEKQRNCSSLADYEDIDNVHDCKKFASEAGHPFKGTLWSNYYSKGCFWYESKGNKMVYYNYHLTGGFRSDAIPVCVNTKKEANIETSSIDQKITALEERIKKLEQIKGEAVLSSVRTLEKNQKEMMNTLTRPLINLDQ